MIKSKKLKNLINREVIIKISKKDYDRLFENKLKPGDSVEATDPSGLKIIFKIK